MADTITITVERNAEGNCCLVGMDGDNGLRLAGPKGWGGTTVLHTFEVNRKDLLHLATEPEED